MGIAARFTYAAYIDSGLEKYMPRGAVPVCLLLALTEYALPSAYAADPPRVNNSPCVFTTPPPPVLNATEEQMRTWRAETSRRDQLACPLISKELTIGAEHLPTSQNPPPVFRKEFPQMGGASPADVARP